MNIRDTDSMVVYRNGVMYKVAVSKLLDTMQDSDLLVTHRSGMDRYVSGKDFRDYVVPPRMPWDDEKDNNNGGCLFHITNLSGAGLKLNNFFPIWNDDGTNRRVADNIPLRGFRSCVILTARDSSYTFDNGNASPTWNFGPLTDVREATNLQRLLAGCKAFNGTFGGKWDSPDNKSMVRFMFNCRVFNQDISMLNVSNVTNFQLTFECCFQFNQDISGWDVRNARDVIYMFRNCQRYNQDLSQWCTFPSVSSGGFDEFTYAWPEHYKPVWGTCPPGLPDPRVADTNSSSSSDYSSED